MPNQINTERKAIYNMPITTIVKESKPNSKQGSPRRRGTGSQVNLYAFRDFLYDPNTVKKEFLKQKLMGGHQARFLTPQTNALLNQLKVARSASKSKTRTAITKMKNLKALKPQSNAKTVRNIKTSSKLILMNNSNRPGMTSKLDFKLFSQLNLHENTYKQNKQTSQILKGLSVNSDTRMLSNFTLIDSIFKHTKDELANLSLECSKIIYDNRKVEMDDTFSVQNEPIKNIKQQEEEEKQSDPDSDEDITIRLNRHQNK